MFIAKVSIVALLYLLSVAVSAQSIVFNPPAPTANDPISVVATYPFGVGAFSQRHFVDLQSHQVFIFLSFGANDNVPDSPDSVIVPIGVLPPGVYLVSLQSDFWPYDPGIANATLTVASVPIPVPAAGPFGLVILFFLISFVAALRPDYSFNATVKGRGDNPAPGAVR